MPRCVAAPLSRRENRVAKGIYFLNFRPLVIKSIVANAAVPAVFHVVLRPEHERVLVNVPVRDHVLPARHEGHLPKVVRLCVEQATGAVSQRVPVASEMGPPLDELEVNSIELLKIFLKIFEILVLENLIETYFLVLKCQKKSIILLN